MAVSTCARCNGHSFELSLFTPLGEARKLTMVPCSTCGTPIGTLDPALGPQIDALKHQVATIDERLNRIAKALQKHRGPAICGVSSIRSRHTSSKAGRRTPIIPRRRSVWTITPAAG
jgi:hypothetical protein